MLAKCIVSCEWSVLAKITLSGVKINECNLSITLTSNCFGHDIVRVISLGNYETFAVVYIVTVSFFRAGLFVDFVFTF